MLFLDKDGDNGTITVSFLVLLLMKTMTVLIVQRL